MLTFSPPGIIHIVNVYQDGEGLESLPSQPWLILKL